jgi:putative transposase
MLKTHLQLPEADRQHLQGLVSRSTISVKTFKRASALLALDGGQSLQQAAAAAGVNYNSVAAWRDRYKAEGLAAALRDRPRSGRPARIDGTQRARITALACSTPPEGHARWSLRLLAGKLVELGYVEAISHNQVGKILKKTRSRPTARRRGAWARSTAALSP